MKDPKNIKGLSTETVKKRLNSMRDFSNAYLNNVENLHISISTGNSKTGVLVPSISLRPLLDCGNCKACSKLCYDFRNDAVYPSVQKSRAKNWAIWTADPERYFREISAACKFFVSFRWHIGGDIVNERYFAGMIQVANENKNVKFLVFTKRFDIVNSYVAGGGRIPENLQIIFSYWRGLKVNNPYNFPSSHPLFADGFTTAGDGAKLCTGNCSECYKCGVNCWALKPGEQVIFNVH